MNKMRILFVILIAFLFFTACVNRMSPFSPHRSNTEAHREIKDNQVCLECHALATLSRAHKPSDDCLQCHRIIQGDKNEE